MTLSAPQPLASHHDVSSFASGLENLDHWLKQRALKKSGNRCLSHFCGLRGAQCTSVRTYYALASSAVIVDAVPGRLRRNMPDPVPVVVLGRLAVDQSLQGRGLDRALVRDAGLRVIQAADIIGMRGMIVHGKRPARRGEVVLRANRLRAICDRPDAADGYAGRSAG